MAITCSRSLWPNEPSAPPCSPRMEDATSSTELDDVPAGWSPGSPDSFCSLDSLEDVSLDSDGAEDDDVATSGGSWSEDHHGGGEDYSVDPRESRTTYRQGRGPSPPEHPEPQMSSAPVTRRSSELSASGQPYHVPPFYSADVFLRPHDSMPMLPSRTVEQRHVLSPPHSTTPANRPHSGRGGGGGGGGGGSGTHRSRRHARRRTRQLLTEEQSRVLHSLLNVTMFPDTPTRLRVAQYLGLSPRKVQVFFQNKRQKKRRLTSAGHRDVSLAAGPNFPLARRRATTSRSTRAATTTPTPTGGPAPMSSERKTGGSMDGTMSGHHRSPTRAVAAAWAEDRLAASAIDVTTHASGASIPSSAIAPLPNPQPPPSARATRLPASRAALTSMVSSSHTTPTPISTTPTVASQTREPRSLAGSSLTTAPELTSPGASRPSISTGTLANTTGPLGAVGRLSEHLPGNSLALRGQMSVASSMSNPGMTSRSSSASSAATSTSSGQGGATSAGSGTTDETTSTLSRSMEPAPSPETLHLRRRRHLATTRLPPVDRLPRRGPIDSFPHDLPSVAEHLHPPRWRSSLLLGGLGANLVHSPTHKVTSPRSRHSPYALGGGGEGLKSPDRPVSSYLATLAGPRRHQPRRGGVGGATPAGGLPHTFRSYRDVAPISPTTPTTRRAPVSAASTGDVPVEAWRAVGRRDHAGAGGSVDVQRGGVGASDPRDARGQARTLDVPCETTPTTLRSYDATLVHRTKHWRVRSAQGAIPLQPPTPTSTRGASAFVVDAHATTPRSSSSYSSQPSPAYPHFPSAPPSATWPAPDAPCALGLLPHAAPRRPTDAPSSKLAPLASADERFRRSVSAAQVSSSSPPTSSSLSSSASPSGRGSTHQRGGALSEARGSRPGTSDRRLSSSAEATGLASAAGVVVPADVHHRSEGAAPSRRAPPDADVQRQTTTTGGCSSDCSEHHADWASAEEARSVPQTPSRPSSVRPATTTAPTKALRMPSISELRIRQ